MGEYEWSFREMEATESVSLTMTSIFVLPVNALLLSILISYTGHQSPKCHCCLTEEIGPSQSQCSAVRPRGGLDESPVMGIGADKPEARKHPCPELWTPFVR